MQLPEFELPHALMLAWLLAGALALSIAHRLHVPARKQVNILLPMGLGLLIFALFVSTRFNYQFVIDDVDIIETNPDVVKADGWKTLWTHDYWAGRSTDSNLYRPITIFSYWANARLPLGAKLVDGHAEEVYPRYFRGVNMILMTGLAWLIALWLAHYVQQTAAWTVAFLFAVHSVHAEQINYVVCRADLLAVLGIVAFLYMQRLAQEAGRWNWWQAIIGLLAAATAFGSKETGLILLPAAAVQAWVGRKHANTDILDDTPPPPLSAHLATAALLLVPAIAYFAARFAVVGVAVDYTSQYMDDMRDNPLRAVPLADRIPAALAIAWFYFRQLFNPDTSYYHLPDALPAWGSSDMILGLTTLIVLTTLLIVYLRKQRWLAIGLVIAAGQYLLIGNLLMPVGVYAANRLILPFSLGAAVLLAGLVHRFCGQSTRRRAVAILPVAAVVALMAPVTQDVNYHWRTEARMIGRDYRLSPDNPIDMYNFGTVRARDAVAARNRARVLGMTLDLIAKAQPVVLAPVQDRAPLRAAVEQVRELWKTLDSDGHQADDEDAIRNTLTLVDHLVAVEPKVNVTAADLVKAEEAVKAALESSSAQVPQFFDEAESLLQRTVMARANSLNAALELANVLQQRGKFEEARHQYLNVTRIAHRLDNDLIELDPRLLVARINYGWLSQWKAEQMTGEGAIKERDAVLKSAQEQLEAAVSALSHLLQAKDRRSPRDAESLRALDKSARHYLSRVVLQRGDKPEAQRINAALLLRYPDFVPASVDIPRMIELTVRPMGHVADR